ncbi:hypothetical protein RD792_004120 [Penstemon davidsonii]|uniref:Reticulon-like protein n=1 Tax=Penstemon davidsonii TaxID=160366 RepID=A0ABR0DHI1_9LAMI|nr:hypothetical protein RD792_004120 [Penstemon davidsonii]
MSDTTESPPSSPKTHLHNYPPPDETETPIPTVSRNDETEQVPEYSESPPKSNPPDIVTDIMLWKKKNLNIILLLSATAIWTLMQIYHYTFLTLLSYVGMAVFTCLFFWANVHRLLKRETPDLSGIGISEQTAIDTANLIRKRIDEVVRLMFHVSVEREWFLSGGVVAALYLLSLVASYFDFLTLCYIGLVGGLTIPVIYMKNEHKIKDLGEKSRVKSRSVYATMEDKMQKSKEKLKQTKDKLMAGKQKEVKEKKME